MLKKNKHQNNNTLNQIKSLSTEINNISDININTKGSEYKEGYQYKEKILEGLESYDSARKKHAIAQILYTKAQPDKNNDTILEVFFRFLVLKVTKIFIGVVAICIIFYILNIRLYVIKKRER